MLAIDLEALAAKNTEMPFISMAPRFRRQDAPVAMTAQDMR